MKKRASVEIGTVDFIASLVVLVVFGLFVFNLTSLQRAAQTNEVLQTAARVDSSTSLITAMQIPLEDSTMGVAITEALVSGEEVFGNGRGELLVGFFSKEFVTAKTDWYAQVAQTDESYEADWQAQREILGNDFHSTTPEVEAGLAGLSGPEVVGRIAGEHAFEGEKVCSSSRVRVASVKLPVKKTQGVFASYGYEIQLYRCSK